MAPSVEFPDVENVILLTIDALRADHLSSFGYNRNTSPKIDQIASKNIVFTNAFSPSCHTREAVPSILSGLYPDECINDKYHLAASTIAHPLSKSRFQTAAFHSNPFISRAYNYDDDFDAFYDDLRIGTYPILALLKRAIDKLRKRHYARATTINEKSLDYIDNIQSPFFVWNHYMDVHGPYEPPVEFQDIFRKDHIAPQEAQRLYKQAVHHPESITKNNKQDLIDLYDAEIRYIDDKISKFINQLCQRDLLDNTLIIITSDHGETFGEYGYYEHPRHVIDELTHVPIILMHPSFDSTRHSDFVSGLDIAPTILNTIDNPPTRLPGISLFKTLAEPEQYTDRIVYSQTRGEKSEDEGSIVKFAARCRTGMCMIERDCQSNTVRTIKVEDESVLQQLQDHSQSRVNYSTGSGTDTSTTVEIEDRLRALGYKE